MQLAEPIASTGGFCVEGLDLDGNDVDYASLTHSMQEQQTRMQALNSRAFTLAALHLPEHMVLAKLAGVIGVWTGRGVNLTRQCMQLCRCWLLLPQAGLVEPSFKWSLQVAQNSQQCWTMLVDEACASKSVDMIVFFCKISSALHALPLATDYKSNHQPDWRLRT